MPRCGFTWSPREGNQLAHEIAKLAAKGDLDSHWYTSPTATIRTIINQDKRTNNHMHWGPIMRSGVQATMGVVTQQMQQHIQRQITQSSSLVGCGHGVTDLDYLFTGEGRQLGSKIVQSTSNRCQFVRIPIPTMSSRSPIEVGQEEKSFFSADSQTSTTWSLTESEKKEASSRRITSRIYDQKCAILSHSSKKMCNIARRG
ncbi:hypothetical protein PIB30_011626 [Stylosanthes scabra]|uniref:RNase H type-1 domain-containing protein n=1 Tax=Stylosanthes scabra TaxID=79078 RepID=A0ABU6W9E4_9FABA|nr:hypothetical protein [Stylosanthes scabra]